MDAQLDDIFAVSVIVYLCNPTALNLLCEAHNLSNNDGIIDVHGLFVAEAVKKVETALQTAIWDRRKELRVIVGRGLHSQGRRPKLRPAIMDEMQR
jgi:hypothetical protein